MAEYKIHPLCEKFPEMPEDEFSELIADIRTNGQRDPIWVWGKYILDGKHRLQACRQLTIEPDIRQWKPKHGPEEPQIVAFVLSKNFYRRHLSASQRAMVVAELINTEIGRPQKGGKITTFSNDDAAAMSSVSPKTMQHAHDVAERGSGPLKEAVRQGEVSANDAAKVVDLPKSEQTAAVKAVKSGEASTVAAAAGVKPKKRRPKTAPIPEVEAPGREPGQDEPEPEHAPDPKRPTDKSGNALPDRPELLKAFSARDLFVSCEKARNVIYNNSYEIAKLLPDGEALKAAVDKHMKALFHTLASFEPAYVCGACNGGKCAKCSKRGYTCLAK